MSPIISILLQVILALFLLTGGHGENSLYKECRPFFLPLDVMFLLDGSGSVSGNTFEMQMHMLKKVAERIDFDSGKSRLAVMQYAGYSRLELQFEANQTRNQVTTTLEKIRYMSGSTKTGKALKKARTFLEEERKKSLFGRGRVKQVAIIVSDGHSHDDPSKPAALLRSDGVTLLVLGIGHYINRDELFQIAGSDDRVFQNLHKEEEMNKFIKSFVNTSQQIVCDYARKPRGATTVCNRDGFTVTVSTTEKLMARWIRTWDILYGGCGSYHCAINFHGALYVTGHYNVTNCIARQNKLIRDGEIVHYDTVLTVNYKDCGVQETFTESTRLFSTIVILQFDSQLTTSQDIFYRIRCEKEEISGNFKALEENVTIARPICRYSVRPTGNCGAITLNDQLIHTWKCDSERVEIDVNQCYMVDSVMHRSYPLLDENGCSISPYISDAKQISSSILTAKGTAIRFATSPLVSFRCNLRICGGGSCEKQNCRKKREISADEIKPEEEYEYNEEFPPADVRKTSILPPIEETTKGRAIVKPLAIHQSPLAVDVALRSGNLAIINRHPSPGGEPLKELVNRRADLMDEKSPSLIVFGSGKSLEKITPKTTAATTSKIPTTQFPTLFEEFIEATTLPMTLESPWQIEIIVESDPILIRLPQETFTTSCNKN